MDIGCDQKKGHLLMSFFLSQDFAVLKGIIKVEFEVRKNFRNIKSRLLIFLIRKLRQENG